MALEYNIQVLQPRDAKQYSELCVMNDWNFTEGNMRDLIKAYDGYAWGAFLPDGKLISE